MGWILTFCASCVCFVVGFLFSCATVWPQTLVPMVLTILAGLLMVKAAIEVSNRG